MTNINHNAKRLKLMGIKSNRKCPGYCEESNGYYNQTVTELEYDLFFWRKNLLHLLKKLFPSSHKTIHGPAVIFHAKFIYVLH